MKFYPNMFCVRLFFICSVLILSELLMVSAERPAPRPIHEQFVTTNSSFGFELLARLRTRSGNIMLSPFSVGSVLSMTSSGAKGDTLRQMTKVLYGQAVDAKIFCDGYSNLVSRFRSLSTGGADFAVANAAWIQRGYPITESFGRIVQEVYGARLEEVDFGVSTIEICNELNAWIAGRTGNRIQSAIEPSMIDSATAMVLINAVSFRGTWPLAFQQDFTKLSPFDKGDGKTVMVPLMHKVSTLRYAETDQAQFLELPFSDQPPLPEELNTNCAFSMLLLLPRATNDFSLWESALTFDQIENLSDASRLIEVRVGLPRFKFENRLELTKTLTNMGMTNAFTPAANFTGISKAKPLFINFFSIVPVSRLMSLGAMLLPPLSRP